MNDTRYYDQRAHPLGLVTHPEWDGVRDAYNERLCNAIKRERAPEEPKTVPWHFILGIPAMVVGLCLICAVGG